MQYIRTGLMTILIMAAMSLHAMDNDQGVAQMAQTLQSYVQWPEQSDFILDLMPMELSWAYRDLANYAKNSYKSRHKAINILQTLRTQLDESSRTTTLQLLGNVAKGLGGMAIGVGIVTYACEGNSLPLILTVSWGLRNAYKATEQLSEFNDIHAQLTENRQKLSTLLDILCEQKKITS